MARHSLNFNAEEFNMTVNVRSASAVVPIYPRPCKFETGSYALFVNDDGDESVPDYGEPVVVVVHEISDKAAVIYPCGLDPEDHDPDAGNCVLYRVNPARLYPCDQSILDQMFPMEDALQEQAKAQLDALPPGAKVTYVSRGAGNSPDYIAMWEDYQKSLGNTPSPSVTTEIAPTDSPAAIAKGVANRKTKKA
jgi:hypothetical protein